MSAVSSNFIDNIHFYYRKNKKSMSQFPQVEDIGNDGLLRLYYNERRNFTVPGTLYDQKGLVNIAIDSSQLVNKIVSLTWEQHMVFDIKKNIGMDCDVWTLDNVEVTLQYENCTKTVLSADFEDKK